MRTSCFKRRSLPLDDHSLSHLSRSIFHVRIAPTTTNSSIVKNVHASIVHLFAHMTLSVVRRGEACVTKWERDDAKGGEIYYTLDKDDGKKRHQKINIYFWYLFFSIFDAFVFYCFVNWPISLIQESLLFSRISMVLKIKWHRIFHKRKSIEKIISTLSKWEFNCMIIMQI